MNGFILHLQGPMMSFADTGFGQLRDAGPYPSRSLVIGIIAAAMGIERGAERLLDLHRYIRVHTAAAASGSLLVDYHTVLTAGYAQADPVLLRRTGVAGANPLLTDRTYHCDAHFVVYVDSEDGELLGTCRKALLTPVFTSFLGRRSCVPSSPLLPLEPEGQSVLDALCISAFGAHADRQRARRTWSRGALPSIDAYLDGRHPTGDAIMETSCGVASIGAYGVRRDLLVAVPRSYVNRPVTHVRVELPQSSRLASTINEDMYHAAP